MTEEEGRKAVIREALTWRQTPFQWECCIKRVGVDCARFIAAVFVNAGVKYIDIENFPKFPSNWYLHRQLDDKDLLLDEFKKYAVEYDLAEHTPMPGDVLLVKRGRSSAHSAIVIEWPRIIGSAAGFVVTEWQNLYTSPQYGNAPLVLLNPWAPSAGGNIE
jgi:cell wall-associated NlpC family hydrolase